MEMMTYIIEVATPKMTFWEIEKVRANNIEEAKAYLIEVYGKDAFFGYWKATY